MRNSTNGSGRDAERQRQRQGQRQRQRAPVNVEAGRIASALGVRKKEMAGSLGRFGGNRLAMLLLGQRLPPSPRPPSLIPSTTAYPGRRTPSAGHVVLQAARQKSSLVFFLIAATCLHFCAVSLFSRGAVHLQLLRCDRGTDPLTESAGNGTPARPGCGPNSPAHATRRARKLREN